MSGLKLRGVEESKAEALNEQELTTLVNMYHDHCFMGTSHLVLEFFLFMCFSSLHISDAKKIQIDQIGEKEFWYMRGKMVNIRPKVVRVPISEPLRQIINHQRKNRKNGLLWENMIADQKINEKLKDIAVTAGIQKKLCAAREDRAAFFISVFGDLENRKSKKMP